VRRTATLGNDRPRHRVSVLLHRADRDPRKLHEVGGRASRPARPVEAWEASLGSVGMSPLNPEAWIVVHNAQHRAENTVARIVDTWWQTEDRRAIMISGLPRRFHE